MRVSTSSALVTAAAVSIGRRGRRSEGGRTPSAPNLNLFRPFDTNPEIISWEAFMSRMAAGRLWGLDGGDWFTLLGGITVITLLAWLA